MRVELLLFLFLFFCGLNLVSCLKVCKNGLDYYLPFSGDCWDNPIDTMNITEFVRNLGLEAEEHYVTTHDGYTILLVRCYGKITKENPVILGHGTFANGFSFLARMKESLAYTLASSGYEVWIMNYRGTMYCRTHKEYTQDDKEFWNFSYHEIGLHDLRTTVDHVYEQSGKKKSLYAGTSTGSSILMVYSSMLPQEAERKLLGAVLIAPAVKFANQNSKFPLVDPNNNTISRVLMPSHQGALMYNTTVNTFLRSLITSCHLLLSLFDRGMIGLILNRNSDQFNYEALAVAVVNAMDISTERMVMQFTQNILTGEFRQFDYGEEENLKRYDSKKPPLYPIENIPIPLALISGRSDLLTPLEGVEELYEMIPDKRKCGFYVVKDEQWTHFDNVLAEDVMEHVTKPTLGYFEKMESKSCVVSKT